MKADDTCLRSHRCGHIPNAIIFMCTFHQKARLMENWWNPCSNTFPGLASHINNIAAAAALARQPLQFFVDDANLNYRCDAVSSSPWQSLFSGYPKLWTGRHILASPPSEGIKTADGNCTAINYKFSHGIIGTEPDLAFQEMGLVIKHFWHFELQTKAYIDRWAWNGMKITQLVGLQLSLFSYTKLQ